jgi:hypothetical protein
VEQEGSAVWPSAGRAVRSAGGNEEEGGGMGGAGQDAHGEEGGEALGSKSVIRGGVGRGDGGNEVKSKISGGRSGWAVGSDLGVDDGLSLGHGW